MKLLIVGAGGIGSWFIEELCNIIKSDQIRQELEIRVADKDIVEMPQLLYQNFQPGEADIIRPELFRRDSVYSVSKQLKNGSRKSIN